MLRKLLFSIIFSGLVLAGQTVKDLKYVPGEIIIKYEKTGQSARGSDIIAEHQIFVDNLKLSMRELKIKSYSPVFKSIIDEMTEKNLTEKEVIQNKTLNRKNITTLSRIRKTTFSNILLLKIDPVEDIKQAALSLINNRDMLLSHGIRIVYAEPNYLKRTSITPNDPLYTQQWSHRITNIEKAWDTTEGSPNIKIAIIDTGVDPTHPDLMANLITGHNFVDIDTNYYKLFATLLPGEIYTQPGTNCTDYNGHGTHCAGIAAAVGNNGIGVIGTAPKCKIMPLRAGFSILVDGQEYGVLETTTIVQAINYAVYNGANVISMSFGGDSSSLEEETIQNAYYNNVVLIAAAGNNDYAAKQYPGGYTEVLAITSIDSIKNWSKFSNYGLWTAIAAPGENIISTVPLKGGAICDSTGYRVLSGTSMATPYVAGVAALVLSHDSSMSNNLVYQTLRSSVNPAYSSPYYIGTGIIDGSKLFSGSVACISKITVPHNISNLYIVNGNINISGRASGKLFSNYSFEYSDYQSVTPDWQPTGQTYITPVDSGLLATVSITQNGIYYIRLKVTSMNNLIYTDIIGPVTIDTRLKANWPVATGVPISSTPVLCDIDGDGNVETIFTSSNGGIYVLDQYGNNKPGWPVFTTNIYYGRSVLGYCSPAVGDLDNNGKKEIVVRDGRYLYVYNSDGSLRSPWPIDLSGDSLNYFIGNALYGSPAIADLNNDGYKEIIVTYLDGNIFAFDRFGKAVHGYPVRVPTKYVWATVYSTPVVADLNGDGKIDVIIQSFDASTSISKGYLYVYDRWGNVLPGWPKQFGQGSVNSPITVDLNNDGKTEIIASSFLSVDSVNGFGHFGIYAFNSAGNLLTGFPVQLTDEVFGYYSLSGGISAGDINNDGYKEILVAGSGGIYSLWAINRYGRILWSSLPSESGEYNSASVPIIADINNNGTPEILISKYNQINQTGKILVINNTGQIMESLSCVIPELLFATPSIGDIEGNHKLELISGSASGNVYCWELGSPYDSSMLIWPTYQQNYQRTGSFELKPNNPNAVASGNNIALPADYSIQQNYPNPFNPATVVEYSLPVQSRVKIVIYNLLGEVVKEIVNSVQGAGYYNVTFGGGNLSSGVYLYKINAKAVNGSKEFSQIKKMMLLK
jgi:thermitase